MYTLGVLSVTTTRSRWWVVGAGRAGTPLARALATSGHEVTLVVRRPEHAATLLAPESAGERAGGGGAAGPHEGTMPTVTLLDALLADPSALMTAAAPAATPVPLRPPTSARVLLAVPDGVVGRLASRFAGQDVVLVHLSGAMGVEAVRAAGHVGAAAAVHPLRTFPSPDEPPSALVGTLFGVTTSEDEVAAQAAAELVAAAGGRAVELDEAQRPAWHLAATLASNGVFALLQAASQVLGGSGVDASAVGPSLATLAASSAANVGTLGIVDAATGPVVRGDERTIAAHAAALADAAPEVRALWSAVTMSLVQVGEQRGARARSLAAIRAIVAGLDGDGRG